MYIAVAAVVVVVFVVSSDVWASLDGLECITSFFPLKMIIVSLLCLLLLLLSLLLLLCGRVWMDWMCSIHFPIKNNRK